MANQHSITVYEALLLGRLELLIESGVELAFIESKMGITFSKIKHPDEQVPLEWLNQLERACFSSKNYSQARRSYSSVAR